MLSRRELLKSGTLAALGFGTSLRSIANEEGITRSFGMNEGLINLGSNENPYGMSTTATKAAIDILKYGNRYQFNVPSLRNFRDKLAAYHGVDASNILVTAGSGEALKLLADFYKGKGNIVAANPTFAILTNTAKRLGSEVIEVPLTSDKLHDLPAMLKAINDKTVAVYIVNPANPSATKLDPSQLRAFCEEASRKAQVIIDEAYIDYLDDPSSESMLSLQKKNKNIILVNTFSKIHGMAGMRVGYVIAAAETIQELERNSFNLTINCVSNPALAAAMASMSDNVHRNESRQLNNAARKYTFDILKSMNYEIYPSYTNFLFFNLKNYKGDFSKDMMNKKIIVRSNKYTDGTWARVSIGTLDEMRQFTSAFQLLAHNN